MRTPTAKQILDKLAIADTEALVGGACVFCTAPRKYRAPHHTDCPLRVARNRARLSSAFLPPIRAVSA